MAQKKGASKGMPLWGHALWLGLAYAVAIGLIIMATSGWPIPLPGRRAEVPPAPMPEKFIPRKRIDTAQLFNGVTYRSKLETEEGRTATIERGDAESYLVELAVRLKVPRANATLDELSRLNPALGRLVPGLADLLPLARVSDFYHGLYERKVDDVQGSIHRLEQLLSRHNFYDCETILEMTHPRTGRKAILVQAEMDVVTDGSDPDRTTEVDASSQFYQPFTSYKWKRRTDRPSPFAARRQARVSALEAERLKAGAARRAEIDREIRQLKLEIAELKTCSFLVARADPFIVLPGFMLRSRQRGFVPEIGDYAVVIYGEMIYPALLGDAGPSHKIGEASLRLTRQLEPKSSAYSRPVSDLKVTYIVFPRSADKPSAPPDYTRWRERCARLLDEIGGHGGTLFEWRDILKPDAPAPASAPPVAASANRG